MIPKVITIELLLYPHSWTRSLITLFWYSGETYSHLTGCNSDSRLALGPVPVAGLFSKWSHCIVVSMHQLRQPVSTYRKHSISVCLVLFSLNFFIVECPQSSWEVFWLCTLLKSAMCDGQQIKPSLMGFLYPMAPGRVPAYPLVCLLYIWMVWYKNYEWVDLVATA